LTELVPKDERRKITARRRKLTLRRTSEQGRGEEGFRLHQSDASKTRWKNEKFDSETMTRARGLTPWSALERDSAFFLRTQSDYQYGRGPNKGRPNHSAIAKALNDEFHTDRHTRNSVRGLLNAPQKQIKQPL
jgi:hypothetical protein